MGLASRSKDRPRVSRRINCQPNERDVNTLCFLEALDEMPCAARDPCSAYDLPGGERTKIADARTISKRAVSDRVDRCSGKEPRRVGLQRPGCAQSLGRGACGGWKLQSSANHRIQGRRRPG